MSTTNRWPGPVSWGFVDPRDRLFWQLSHRLIIGWSDRCGGLILQFHHPSRRTRLIQNLLQDQGDAALTLLKAAHQQGGEGNQSWSRLTVRHTRRKFTTGRDAAARTVQAVALKRVKVYMYFGELKIKNSFLMGQEQDKLRNRPDQSKYQ